MHKGLPSYLLIVTGVLLIVITIISFQKPHGILFASITTLFFSTWGFVHHFKIKTSINFIDFNSRLFLACIICMIFSIIGIIQYFLN